MNLGEDIKVAVSTVAEVTDAVAIADLVISVVIIFCGMEDIPGSMVLESPFEPFKPGSPAVRPGRPGGPAGH